MLAPRGIVIPMDPWPRWPRSSGVATRELALFGSAPRDDFCNDSDNDVLVEFEPDAGCGLRTHMALQLESSYRISSAERSIVSRMTAYNAFVTVCSTPRGCRMRPKQEAWLHDILDALTPSLPTSHRLDYDAFAMSRLVRDAILHALAMMGETTNKPSQELCDAHSEVARRWTIALRHVILHGYISVRWDRM